MRHVVRLLSPWQIMLGRQSRQRGLFEGDHLWIDHVGRFSFYGFLAAHRHELFDDQDFQDLFPSPDGRPSIPPSLLAAALVLQLHDGVSDEEARQRAWFDARWKVALGLEMEAKPFATATLRRFRTQLARHESAGLAYRRSLAFLRGRGYLNPEGSGAVSVPDGGSTVLVGGPSGKPVAASRAGRPAKVRRRYRIQVTDAAW